jgi:hypothetical protein
MPRTRISSHGLVVAQQEQIYKFRRDQNPNEVQTSISSGKDHCLIKSFLACSRSGTISRTVQLETSSVTIIFVIFSSVCNRVKKFTEQIFSGSVLLEQSGLDRLDLFRGILLFD